MSARRCTWPAPVRADRSGASAHRCHGGILPQLGAVSGWRTQGRRYHPRQRRVRGHACSSLCVRSRPRMIRVCSSFLLCHARRTRGQNARRDAWRRGYAKSHQISSGLRPLLHAAMPAAQLACNPTHQTLRNAPLFTRGCCICMAERTTPARALFVRHHMSTLKGRYPQTWGGTIPPSQVRNAGTVGQIMHRTLAPRGACAHAHRSASTHARQLSSLLLQITKNETSGAAMPLPPPPPAAHRSRWYRPTLLVATPPTVIATAAPG
jgi:hypothetical protein